MEAALTVLQPTLVPREEIEKVVAEIARRFQPERILLFGSYAYGTPTPYSDVDLLVVVDHPGRNRRMAHEIHTSISFPFTAEIIVWKPKELRDRLTCGDQFLREIVAKGQTLYAPDICSADNG